MLRHINVYLFVVIIFFSSLKAAFADQSIYIAPERLAYAYPLEEDIKMIGYLRNLPDGALLDIRVSLQLPDGTYRYLNPTLEFHPANVLLLTKFPFVAVPTADLFTLNATKLFNPPATEGGKDPQASEMPPGRYVLKTTLSGAASDRSEVAFFIVAKELLPSIVTTPNPVIDSLDPPYGAPGDIITAKGRNFRGKPDVVDNALVSQLMVKVTQADLEGQVLSVNEDGSELTFQVPQQAVNGPVEVHVHVPYWVETPTTRDLIPMSVVLSSNEFPFWVKPRLEDFGVQQIAPAQSVVITGKNFYPDKPEGNIIYFDGVRATVTAATATSLTVTVPYLGSAPKYVSVVATTSGISSDPFYISYVPIRVTALIPKRIVQGSTATLYGSGFSATLEENRVFVSGVPVKVTAATETQLDFQTDNKTPSGYVTVNIKGFAYSTSFFLTMLPTW